MRVLQPNGDQNFLKWVKQLVFSYIPCSEVSVLVLQFLINVLITFFQKALTLGGA